ncbi:EamA-like transporter family protein [Pseudovibrio axinellae]|uniref:EamA-like transporter family protein n=1 Tax=Pseudovibrio axinellae TaxID=989403 RepID=A0A165YZK3_9HYPH|nr:DMT family transporter [Pseudovibrio axinellae]KZL19376.1 EamA-like transporter family protein [Pseudovibrio axinellae]SEQ39029.1 EamA-like transporter family protein [Pseudovibrio axinellae]
MSVFLRSAPPTLLIVAIGVFVGVSYTLSKVAIQANIGPLTALFWQLLVATLLLFVLGFLSGQRLQVTRHHLIYYIGSGLLGISLPALVAYTVLEHISTGLYSVLITLSPLFTFVITASVERKMLPIYRLWGIIIGLVGISFATLGGIGKMDSQPIWIVLAILGPLLLAMGNVFRSRSYPQSGEPIMIAAGTLLSQLILCLPFVVASGMQANFVSPTPYELTPVLGVGLITAISYVLTFEVQRRTDGVTFAQVGYFATLSGIGMGAVAFGEPIGLALFAALIILFLGLAISNGQIKLSRIKAL